MATRAIVTSQPVVACDVCGRRLLRGETPDVFLAGGQRRTVCELCVPRAAAEGWLREADEHDLALRPARARRRGSLFGRLRQLREGEEQRRHGRPDTARRRATVQEGALYDAEDPVYDFLEGGSTEGAPAERAAYLDSVLADAGPVAEDAVEAAASSSTDPVAPLGTAGEPRVARALELFNAGETTQRLAGVSRSLGAPTVMVREGENAGGVVTILVAWELCWYRYEVDLGEEADGVRLVAEGLELDELPVEERLANASVDERGRILLMS